MKKFNIGVTYKVWGLVEVEAKTLEEAIEWAKENIKDINLPFDTEYVEDSIEIDDDIEIAKSFQL